MDHPWPELERLSDLRHLRRQMNETLRRLNRRIDALVATEHAREPAAPDLPTLLSLRVRLVHLLAELDARAMLPDLVDRWN